jgi:hypothetical protein
MPRPWISPAKNQTSPTRLDGGRGFSRTRFAEANSPAHSLRTPHGDGITELTDGAAGAL